MIELIHLKCNPELKVYFKAILCLTVVVFNLGCSSNPTIDIPQEALDADGYQLTKIVKTENDRGLVTEEHWYTTTYNKSGRITNESEKRIQQSFNEMDSLIEKRVISPGNSEQIVEHTKKEYNGSQVITYQLAVNGDTLFKEIRNYRAYKVMSNAETIYYDDNVIRSYARTSFYYGLNGLLDSMVLSSMAPSSEDIPKPITLDDWRKSKLFSKAFYTTYNDEGYMTEFYELREDDRKSLHSEWIYKDSRKVESRLHYWSYYGGPYRYLFDEREKLIKQIENKDVTLFYYKEDADWQVHYKSD